MPAPVRFWIVCETCADPADIASLCERQRKLYATEELTYKPNISRHDIVVPLWRVRPGVRHSPVLAMINDRVTETVDIIVT
jgi:hypothetical protein